jgi:WD40 repeat protein
MFDSVAFSPDGRAIETGSRDGRIRVWSGFLWRDRAGLRAEVCRLVVGDLTRAERTEFAFGLAYSQSCPA